MASVLDAPPPASPPQPGVPPEAGLSQLMGPAGQAGGGVSPDMLKWIVGGGDAVASFLETLTQILPQQAATLAMMRDSLSTVIADAVKAGAPALSPTTAGLPFPGTLGQGAGIAGAGGLNA